MLLLKKTEFLRISLPYSMQYADIVSIGIILTACIVAQCNPSKEGSYHVSLSREHLKHSLLSM